jgi:hypothetical protein
LNFVNTISSSVSGCSNKEDCLSNIILSLAYLIVLALWFGFLSVLGYAAQDRRSKRMAQILIAAEVMVLLVSLFDAKHYPNILGLVISLTDATLAVWVISLAYRLMRANGGRVVSPTRRHRSKAQL